MAIVTQKIGPISAYAIAKEEGYTGTKEQFATEIGNASVNAQAAAASATAAEGYATSAATSASNAMSTTPTGYNSMMASIAAEYDATATYAVGDYCRYNSEVYRCVTAVSTAEAFDSTKWTKAVIGNEISQLSEDINDLIVDSPSTNIADLDYINASGYPVASYKNRLDIIPLDTGVRLSAKTSITTSTYIMFYFPIADYYGKTINFHCTVTKGAESTKPRFAARYWDGTTVTAIDNASSSSTLTFDVVDEETATAAGYTDIRFEFYITYTSASISTGDYVDFTDVKITVGKPYDSKYTSPVWHTIPYNPQTMNRVEFLGDESDFYFESVSGGLYFYFSGSLYLRGIYPNLRTLRMYYNGTSSAVRTFDAVGTLVTSPSGKENCLYVANGNVIYYDFVDDKLKSCAAAAVTDDMFVIFFVNNNKICGGVGQYLYSSVHPSTEILETYKETKSKLDATWNGFVQPIQIAQQKQFIFAVQTDTHYDPQELYYTNGSHAGNSYASNLSIFSQFVGMNFIANLGDIVCGYAVNTQDDTRKAMTDIVNRYVSNAKCPVLLAVGNHDDGVLYTTSNGTQHYSIDEILTGAELYGRIGVPMYNTGNFEHGKQLYYYIDFDDVRVIVLNTRDNAYQEVSSSDVNINRHNISNTQLEWFQNILSESTGKKIIVATHVGLVDGVLIDGAEYKVINGENVVAALETFVNNGGTVIACLSGHTHVQMDDKVNGINYICFDDGGNFAEVVMVDTEARTITTKLIGNVPSGDVDRSFTY